MAIKDFVTLGIGASTSVKWFVTLGLLPGTGSVTVTGGPVRGILSELSANSGALSELAGYGGTLAETHAYRGALVEVL